MTFHGEPVPVLGARFPIDAGTARLMGELGRYRIRAGRPSPSPFVAEVEAIHRDLCVLPWHPLAECPGARS